jgi:hypothetical protein
MERHVLAHLKDLELAIVFATQRVRNAKDELKDANAALAAAYEALREYARELTDPEKTPLFEHVDRTTGEITTDDQANGAEA